MPMPTVRSQSTRYATLHKADSVAGTSKVQIELDRMEMAVQRVEMADPQLMEMAHVTSSMSEMAEVTEAQGVRSAASQHARLVVRPTEARSWRRKGLALALALALVLAVALAIAALPLGPTATLLPYFGALTNASRRSCDAFQSELIRSPVASSAATAKATKELRERAVPLIPHEALVRFDGFVEWGPLFSLLDDAVWHVGIDGVLAALLDSTDFSMGRSIRSVTTVAMADTVDFWLVHALGAWAAGTTLVAGHDPGCLYTWLAHSFNTTVGGGRDTLGPTFEDLLHAAAWHAATASGSHLGFPFCRSHFHESDWVHRVVHCPHAIGHSLFYHRYAFAHGYAVARTASMFSVSIDPRLMLEVMAEVQAHADDDTMPFVASGAFHSYFQLLSLETYRAQHWLGHCDMFRNGYSEHILHTCFLSLLRYAPRSVFAPCAAEDRFLCTLNIMLASPAQYDGYSLRAIEAVRLYCNETVADMRVRLACLDGWSVHEWRAERWRMAVARGESRPIDRLPSSHHLSATALS
jgi:hypothetical protein